jgi:hypothetical protein
LLNTDDSKTGKIFSAGPYVSGFIVPEYEETWKRNIKENLEQIKQNIVKMMKNDKTMTSLNSYVRPDEIYISPLDMEDTGDGPDDLISDSTGFDETYE